MIDYIDLKKCIGCGICVNSCEADVIRIDEATGKAVIAYQNDCTLCAWCEEDCPQKAIHISPELYIPLSTFWGHS